MLRLQKKKSEWKNINQEDEALKKDFLLLAHTFFLLFVRFFNALNFHATLVCVHLFVRFDIIFDIHNSYMFSRSNESNNNNEQHDEFYHENCPQPPDLRLKKRSKEKVSVESLWESCHWLKWNIFHPRLFEFCFMLPFVVWMCCAVCTVAGGGFCCALYFIFHPSFWNALLPSLTIYYDSHNENLGISSDIKLKTVYVDFELH